MLLIIKTFPLDHHSHESSRFFVLTQVFLLIFFYYHMECLYQMDSNDHFEVATVLSQLQEGSE